MAGPPSSEGVALIVGTGVATYTALLLTAGYFGRRFLSWQTGVGERFNKNDEANETILRKLESVSVLERRVSAVEKGHKKHRKILDRLAWIMEDSRNSNGKRYKE